MLSELLSMGINCNESSEGAYMIHPVYIYSQPMIKMIKGEVNRKRWIWIAYNSKFTHSS